MKGCAEVLALLACLFAERSPAQTAGDAARELARKIAAVAPKETVTPAFLNRSSLAAAQFDEVRGVIESELRAAGLHLSEGSAGVRVTVSETVRDYLLVAEISRGEERIVVMAQWPRPAAGARPAAATVTLEKKLVREQDEPILDFALVQSGGARLLLVLEPGRVAVYGDSTSGWEPRQSFPVTPAGPLPRDLRGRLTVEPPAFQAYLPGVACRGTLDPPALDCKPGDTLWPLASGATFAGMAAFRPGRNLFEGAIATAAGARATVPPFFSMALAGSGPQPLWVFATSDGRAAVYDAALAPRGFDNPGWGSDIAGAEARCGSGRQVLATRPSDAAEPDGLQAWDIAGSQATPVSVPLDLPGPVTALWPAGAAGAGAVVRNPQTGRYAAYAVAIGCGS